MPCSPCAALSALQPTTSPCACRRATGTQIRTLSRCRADGGARCCACCVEHWVLSDFPGWVGLEITENLICLALHAKRVSANMCERLFDSAFRFTSAQPAGRALTAGARTNSCGAKRSYGPGLQGGHAHYCCDEQLAPGYVDCSVLATCCA